MAMNPEDLGQAPAAPAVPTPEAPAPMPQAMPRQRRMAEEMDEPIKFDNEDDELLFGPTDRPDEPMSQAGRRGMARRPKNMERYLPVLTNAAASPDAPQELHDLLRVLQYHMGGGN